MFSSLQPQPDDPLLALMGAFRADQRPNKLDLGVGVYRDASGITPVMRAVKQAERQILETQTSKGYVSPVGDQGFLDLLAPVVLGDDHGRAVTGVQTPGGTGALGLAAKLLAHAGAARVWVGLPTWPNHMSILEDANLPAQTFPFFDVDSQEILFDGMIERLKTATPGDGVLLHAACHNPTGAALSMPQWQALAEVMLDRGLVPLIDSAYQGFGDGLDADAEGLRCVIRTVPVTLVATSCSKNFGLYRERTGAVFAVADTQRTANAMRSNLVHFARSTYSMPPDHGAAVVREILGTPALHGEWETELADMRGRINGLRNALAEAMAPHWDKAAAIAGEQGMFSLLPLTAEDVAMITDDHAIYMPRSGRISIAGLTEAAIPRLVAAFAERADAT